MRRLRLRVPLLARLAVLSLCVALQPQGSQARPQRAAGAGSHLGAAHHHAQLSGAAANSMAPLTSEWRERDESVRRRGLSAHAATAPEDGDAALLLSPYAWKPLLSESRPSRKSRDQQNVEVPAQPAEPAADAAAPQSVSSSGPSAPSAPSAPVADMEVAASVAEPEIVSPHEPDEHPPQAQALIRQPADRQSVAQPAAARQPADHQPAVPAPTQPAAPAPAPHTHGVRQPSPAVPQADHQPDHQPEPAVMHTARQPADHQANAGPEQATSRAQPMSPSAMSSPSAPSSPATAFTSPTGSAPTGASPIGESLKEVASQLMEVTAAPNQPAVTKAEEGVLQDVRTPPILRSNAKPIKAQDLRKSDLPKPVMVSATVSTERDDDDHNGFQGVAEPVVLPDEHMSMSTAGPAAAPEVKKSNASAIMTTAEPQQEPSTTASDRISTWILLSGTHSTVTTPSTQKKRPVAVVAHMKEHQKTGSQGEAAKVPNPPHKPQPARPPPGVRKPMPQNKPAVRKPAPTTTTTTTVAPTTTSTTPPTPTSQAADFVKISETVVSSLQKQKLPATESNNKKANKPANNTEPNLTAKRPIQDKTKVSAASVPFSPALSFRRKPIQGTPIAAIPDLPIKPVKAPKPVSALKTTAAPTTPKPTTTTPAEPEPEELTTIPATVVEIAVTTEDPNMITTTLPPATTKKPKRTGSSTKKKKKKNKNKSKTKNKNRRRRPSKTAASASSGNTTSVIIESKIGTEGNVTKVGQNGISTKIYNYLAREVMPSVSVGIIGLVVTAGIAGLFLYPFGGGIAARRTYDEGSPDQNHPNEHNYYYENYADHGVYGAGGKPEEEVLGQVFSGMQQQQQQAPETRYAGSPSIYGGGDSGPPDAQYPDSYSRYDSSGKGSAYSRPDSSHADDLRQGTGYSSVSVNGQGQVTGYADPAPESAASDAKYETMNSDALQRTRYDVDTPADQVDITYGAAGPTGADGQAHSDGSNSTPVLSKAEDSPYVVGSAAAHSQQSQGPGTRYRLDDTAANVDITYGSGEANHPDNHAKDGAVHSASFSANAENDSKANNRYSVRVGGSGSGGSGQVAMAYGSQSSPEIVKLEQADAAGMGNVDLTYSAGLAGMEADSRYATANGAQPRAILPEPRALHEVHDSKTKMSRRRRSASDDDDSKLNEIDGPVPSSDKKNEALSKLPVKEKVKDPEQATTTSPEEMTTTADAMTTLVPDSSENESPVEMTKKVETSNKLVSTEASSTEGSSTLKPLEVFPMVSSTTETPVNTTDDPFSVLMNIFRRVAEFKLRVGMNLLRGTSEAVTRYISGVTQRMEVAAENLHQARAASRGEALSRLSRAFNSRRWARASEGQDERVDQGGNTGSGSTAFERTKHHIKKVLRKHEKKAH